MGGLTPVCRMAENHNYLPIHLVRTYVDFPRRLALPLTLLCPNESTILAKPRSKNQKSRLPPQWAAVVLHTRWV